jgi:6-phosphogluconate dehydrogenase (decarboxylating)
MKKRGDNKMEKDGQLGDAKYHVEFSAGVAKVSVSYVGTYAGAEASVMVPAKAIVQPILEKLKAAIPGQIDDVIIDALEKLFE